MMFYKTYFFKNLNLFNFKLDPNDFTHIYIPAQGRNDKGIHRTSDPQLVGDEELASKEPTPWQM